MKILKNLFYAAFNKGYRQWLFSKGDNPRFTSKWNRLICRLKGHPAGQIFYTCQPNATEPDDRCANCGDYI